MRRALDHALRHGGSDGGPCAKAVVIGTDIPSLDASHVDRAVKLLDAHDVVFGPAVDGGYYLLGVRDRGYTGDGGEGSDRGGGDGGEGSDRGVAGGGGAHPAIFTDIPWSTGTVLRDSTECVRRGGHLGGSGWRHGDSARRRHG